MPLSDVNVDVNRLLERLVAEHPQVELVDDEPYNLERYNQSAAAGDIKLCNSDIMTAHPGFVVIPCTEDLSLQICLAYPLHPTPATQEFVDAVAAQAARSEDSSL